MCLIGSTQLLRPWNHIGNSLPSFHISHWCFGVPLDITAIGKPPQFALLWHHWQWRAPVAKPWATLSWWFTWVWQMSRTTVFLHYSNISWHPSESAVRHRGLIAWEPGDYSTRMSQILLLCHRLRTMNETIPDVNLNHSDLLARHLNSFFPSIFFPVFNTP